MTKQVVIDFFGGVKPTSHALNLTDSAVRMWPDRLSERVAAQVLVAALKVKGLDAARQQWPAMFERKAS